MWITRKGYEVLLQKLAALEKKRKKMLTELGEQAERDSDLPENPIWKQLQVELRFNLPKEMSDLQKIISESRIIEDELHSQLDDQNEIHLGSEVKIRINDNNNDNKEKVVVLIGPYDIGVVSNGVSYLSPLGKALLGAKKGEERTFTAPKGERKVMTLSIKKGL